MSMHPKTIQYIQWEGQAVHSWKLEPIHALSSAPVVVMMHGAGTSDSTRAEPLAQAFADCGVAIVSFDFVGHGKTGGEMKNMSLQQRTEVALTVINYWTKPKDELILCGFSMSGHTALMLSERLGGRVRAMSLMAPGVYAAEAETIPFTEAFSNIIRRPESWKNSLALTNAKTFSGRVHMLMSTHDEVIPWVVAEHLLAAFRHSAQEVRFDLLKEPDHKVAVWLGRHPERGHDIMRYLLGIRHV
jgi:uncharacterized protein